MRYVLLVLIVACSSGSQPAAQSPPPHASIDATPVVVVDAPIAVSPPDATPQVEAGPPQAAPPDAAVAAPPQHASAECTSSSDCIIYCPRAKGCCSSACGCRNAMRADHKAAADAEFARTCEKTTRCPIEDCKYIETHAACEGGRCVAKTGGGPDL